MSDQAKDDVYLCVIEHKDEPHPRGYKSGTSIDELVKWAEDKNHPAKSQKPDTKPPEDKVPSLGTLMNNIAYTGNHQNELISLTSAVRSSFPMTMFGAEVAEPVFSGKEPERTGENFRIGKIEKAQIPTVIASMDKINRLGDGLNHLPNAIFLSLIATFDSQMSDIVRAMLSIKSDRLKFSARQVPLAKIMSASSIDEIVQEQIIEEVYLFSRGSHDEQVAFIEDNFTIEIRASWKRWPEFIEIFERRNLVAHGERRYTKRYVDICTNHKFKDADKNLGEVVKLSHSYMTSSLSILSEFAILTIFMLWRKHVPTEKDKCFDAINEVAFNCITSHQSRLASRLCEFALSLKNSGVKEAPRLRLVVNLASAFMHLDDDTEATKVLGREDWSATSDDFQISVAALRKDVDEVNRLLPMIKAAGRLSASEFRIWPVFNFIKDDLSFQTKYEEVYGEKLIIAPTGIAIAEQASADENDAAVDLGTVH